MSYESFGTHQNFGDLKNQILNEFLTEIILRISSDNGLPPVNDFCQVFFFFFFCLKLIKNLGSYPSNR